MTDGRGGSVSICLYSVCRGREGYVNQNQGAISVSIEDDVMWQQSRNSQKIDTASKSVSLSCCRLCKLVGDISHWRNLYSKDNSQLLASAEDLYGKALPQSNVLPHLVCRPCERKRTNFKKIQDNGL